MHRRTWVIAWPHWLPPPLQPPSSMPSPRTSSIAIIASKTGPLEAYAKQTIVGFHMGLNYATGGTMTGGRQEAGGD
jgi:branched-chain amino acid transport system substrate-binding protein